MTPSQEAREYPPPVAWRPMWPPEIRLTCPFTLGQPNQESIDYFQREHGIGIEYAYVDADRKARQQEAQALARLWPLFERATKDLVFTAERAGEVMADMNTLRAAIAKGGPQP